MKRLTATCLPRRVRRWRELEQHFAESAKLEDAIRSNLKGLGYGG